MTAYPARQWRQYRFPAASFIGVALDLPDGNENPASLKMSTYPIYVAPSVSQSRQVRRAS
jgi:hypothetical protein